MILTLTRISFMGEFTVQVGPAASQKDADEFGAAFTPEDMYTVIHRLERFSTFTVSIHSIAPGVSLTLV